MGSFGKQWLAFRTQMDKMGSRIDDAQKEYQRLVAVRSNQLDRVLTRIAT